MIIAAAIIVSVGLATLVLSSLVRTLESLLSVVYVIARTNLAWLQHHADPEALQAEADLLAEQVFGVKTETDGHGTRGFGA